MRGQVGPRLTAVLRGPQLAVVGPCPEQSRLQGGLDQRVDSAVRLGAAAHRRRLRGVLRGEVGTERLPLLAPRGELEDVVAPEEEGALFVPAADQGGVPMEAELGLALCLGRADAPRLACAKADPLQRAGLRLVVD